MKISGTARTFAVNGRSWLLGLALALPAGLAFGGQGEVNGESLLAMDSTIDSEAVESTIDSEAVHSVAGTDGQTAGEGAQSSARRLEVGMSLEEALQLVGKDPDSKSEIGAACGMLDVLTWDDDGTRLISVDGTVTSIFEGKNSESQ